MADAKTRTSKAARSNSTKSAAKKKAARKTRRTAKRKTTPRRSDPLRFASKEEAAENRKRHLHLYGKTGAVCDTDTLGHATPRNRSPVEIVVDASEGFIPLWDRNVTLRWRFNEPSMSVFVNPTAARGALRALFGDAILLWDWAAPVRFAERDDAWDFEIEMQPSDRCDANGCVLASAFFPDPGQNTLRIYPKIFEQTRDEQVETLAHELGHVFGLRHFFALVDERAWPARVFGNHSPFSIMNYGPNSVMTHSDREDLRRLYESAWSGELADINGTPIQFFKPYSAARGFSNDLCPGQSAQISPVMARAAGVGRRY